MTLYRSISPPGMSRSSLGVLGGAALPSVVVDIGESFRSCSIFCTLNKSAESRIVSSGLGGGDSVLVLPRFTCEDLYAAPSCCQCSA